ncbi:MAG: hypothetical protein DIU80_022905 [Chloroflexota bacterium]
MNTDRSSPSARLFQAGLAAAHERFDPEAGLLAQRTDTGLYHPIRESFAYAAALVRADGERALPRAEQIIRRALQAQERQEGNIHHGGFKWMDEDQGVTDLNAVQFALEQLLPFYLDHAERLSPELRAELLECFRIAAAELERLEVHVLYTNIALLDTLNTALAARALGDERLRERARRRFDEWIAFTNRSGAVVEYNSPTYAAVDLGALAELAERAEDHELRVKAQLMEERLWLHAAVHYHHPTAQLAGPHGRAYHNDVTGGICGIKRVLFEVLGDERLLRRSAYAPQRQSEGSIGAGRPFHLPDYIQRLLREKPAHYVAAEASDADNGVDLYTFMTGEYALGTASVGNHSQNDRLILYYRAPAPRDVGVLFSRYIVNEATFGSHYHATDRSTANNLPEQGQFWGMQHEGKSIALYGLQPQHAPVHSLKTEVYLLDAAQLGEVWVNEQRLEREADGGLAERALQPHDALLVRDGDTYIAVRPLAPTNLGRAAPILLRERGGELVLSIYNYYQGEPKSFWEYAQLAGPFYRQNIRAGFVLEVGDREQYGDFAAFRAHVLRGAIEDWQEGTVRRVRYASGPDLLEIAVDLRANRLLERRVNGAPYAPPMLWSPTAVQGRSGPLRAGGAALSAEGAPAWLVADDEHACWAAANPSDEAVRLRLETPAATVESAAFGFGRIVVRGGGRPEIEVLAVRREAPLIIHSDERPAISWNGADVSDQCARYNSAWVLPPRPEPAPGVA